MNVINSLKAITLGSLFIVITSLILQLIALFVMVGYTHLEHAYPFLSDISGVFRYLVGIPLFLLILILGGYVTAFFARTNIVFHCFMVGLITSIAMFWLALENATLTTTGIIIFILMMVATIAGGLYWKKKSQQNY